MTLPTHCQLMLAEIASNNALSPAHIQAERQHAQKLLQAGFATAAFLHLWIVTEVAAKELMSIYKYTKDTHDALKKMQPELSRSLATHIGAPTKNEAHTQAKALCVNALPSLAGSLHGIFKVHAQSSCRQLDIAVIKTALTTLAISFTGPRLEYLLATKVAALPAGIDLNDKTTVRERRNKLVHSNGTVTAATATQLLPIFDEFFGLLQQVSNAPEHAQNAQPHSANEVAQ